MNICMIAYSFYEYDARVRRYAETLAKRGDQVDVLSLRQQGQSSFELIEGVNVYRIQRRVINETGKLSYLFKLVAFFFLSMLAVTRKHLRKRYDVVHVHSVPDFEVFAAWFPKLTGALVFLDIHDIVPEFYATKFNVSMTSMTFKLLVLVERLSTAFADHVIAANDIWGKRLVDRAVPARKCTSLLNFPDTDVFRPHGRTRTDDKLIMIYPGTINHHQGLDLAVRALARIKDLVPEAEFHIYGKGPSKESLAALIKEMNLEDRVFLRGLVLPQQLVSIIENADLGVVPKRRNPFSDEAFSTKTLEFMALNVPVLVANTKIDKFYFDDSVVKFFEAENEEDLAKAMLTLLRDPQLRQRLAANGREYVGKNSWEVKKEVYLDLVDAARPVRTLAQPAGN